MCVCVCVCVCVPHEFCLMFSTVCVCVCVRSYVGHCLTASAQEKLATRPAQSHSPGSSPTQGKQVSGLQGLPG